MCRLSRLPTVAAAALAATFVLLHALLGASAVSAQPLHLDEHRLDIDIDSVEPRMISTDSRMLSVSGEVTNIGDRPINDLSARVQLGQPQQSAEQVTEAIVGEARTDAQQSSFTHVAETLAPGHSARVELSVPINDGPDGLQLTEPGIHPMLVNINGQPENGGPARLGALNMLLPVLDGGDTPGDAPGTDSTGQDSQARPVSMLWPIAASPRVLADPLEGNLVLSDDELAESMQRGGRLDALVNGADALENHPELQRSTCFAIDPDLVTTAESMTDGYEVSVSDTHEGTNGDTVGDTVSGTGAEDAQRWLDSLAELIEDECVLTMPYAAADASTLASTSPELAQVAIANDEVLTDVLDVDTRTQAFWPQGPLTPAMLDALDEAGKTTLLSDSTQLQGDRAFARTTMLRSGDNGQTQQRAVPIDELVSLGFSTQQPRQHGNYPMLMAPGTPELATQNGLAALAFRAMSEPSPSDAPLIAAPPREWSPSSDEVTRMVEALDDFTDMGLITASPVAETLNAEAVGSARPVTEEAGESAGIPPDVTEEINTADGLIQDLYSATSVDLPTQVEPSEVLRPLRHGLLRATSEQWQQDPATARSMATRAREQVDKTLDMVYVDDPGRTISMASGSSPLPVVVQNELPVEITVQLSLSNTLGLRPETVSDLTMPANSSYTQQVPVEALRAGRFSVDVTLSTPGGTELGDPARLELASTQYGLITVIVTATAAGALLLLSGRRIYQRVRSGSTERD